ncbi:hypothetical protein GCM10009630_17090 [Kribbella jejuensis]|uniref:Uncharacterized protein n=2 Tax=Kribbella jejuensis TaxID=236068 RepID=A0A542EBF0_9ACTN|nr:hypothetical protein FB475_5587 [Kribbella jejuensis]
MLLVYPLIATATGLDLVWVVFARGPLPAVAYTVGVVVIAAALAVSMHLVGGLPRLACFATLFVAVALANTTLVMGADELIRAGWSFSAVTVAGLGTTTVALLLTVLIGTSAEAIARRRARSRVLNAVPEVAPVLPLPTLVDLVAPTLVSQTAHSQIAVTQGSVTQGSLEPAVASSERSAAVA